MTNLLEYGFPQELMPREDSAGAALVPARVSAVFKERWQLVTPEGERYGRLKAKEYYYEGGQDFPTTGDFVLALPAGDPASETAGDWQIVKTLPRRSFFARMDTWHAMGQAVAANMDVVFAVQSLNENFNVKRLERYLTLAWNSGAQPVVVLTKADLPGDHRAMVEQAENAAGEAPVLVLSAKTGQGMEQLEPYLRPRTTAAFLGSSGVGKSSLINALAGEEVMDTGGIREDDARGRHTTTHRQLLRLPSGVLVIDTPGMRELGMWDAQAGLTAAFPDVERLLGQCRFRDCRHEQEPGCAVRAALESGELSPQRWKNYRQLAGESRASQRMKQGQPSRALAKNWRQASKYKKKFTDFT